jgi:hypothetical protein
MGWHIDDLYNESEHSLMEKLIHIALEGKRGMAQWPPLLPEAAADYRSRREFF